MNWTTFWMCEIVVGLMAMFIYAIALRTMISPKQKKNNGNLHTHPLMYASSLVFTLSWFPLSASLVSTKVVPIVAITYIIGGVEGMYVLVGIGMLLLWLISDPDHIITREDKALKFVDMNQDDAYSK